MTAAPAFNAVPALTDGSRADDLRVVVVSDSTPERNGVGSYYSDLVDQLGERIDYAELLCPEGGDERWHRYLAPPLPGDSTQRIWFPQPFRLWSRIVSAQPHAIIVPTPGPYGLVGMLAARRLGVPLIVGFHTHYEALTDIYWSDAFGKLCRGYLTWCNRLLFRNSALVLANSPDMIRQATDMGAVDAQLMGTSVPSEFLSRPLEPLLPDAHRLLFAGRLAEEKNVPEIIELARARPGFAISIAGDGPLKDDVVRAAAELPNLAYLGWVDRDRIIDVYDAHDLQLLPSKVESFGTVALEGMARGRPVIVSNACGIAEWPELEQGLFKIGDDESLPAAVDRVLALPPAVRAETAKRAHEAARNLNEWNLSTWIDRLNAERRGDAA